MHASGPRSRPARPFACASPPARSPRRAAAPRRWPAPPPPAPPRPPPAGGTPAATLSRVRQSRHAHLELAIRAGAEFAGRSFCSSLSFSAAASRGRKSKHRAAARRRARVDSRRAASAHQINHAQRHDAERLRSLLLEASTSVTELVRPRVDGNSPRAFPAAEPRRTGVDAAGCGPNCSTARTS